MDCAQDLWGVGCTGQRTRAASLASLYPSSDYTWDLRGLKETCSWVSVGLERRCGFFCSGSLFQLTLSGDCIGLTCSSFGAVTHYCRIPLRVGEGLPHLGLSAGRARAPFVSAVTQAL